MFTNYNSTFARVRLNGDIHKIHCTREVHRLNIEIHVEINVAMHAKSKPNVKIHRRNAEIQAETKSEIHFNIQHHYM